MWWTPGIPSIIVFLSFLFLAGVGGYFLYPTHPFYQTFLDPLGFGVLIPFFYGVLWKMAYADLGRSESPGNAAGKMMLIFSGVVVSGVWLIMIYLVILPGESGGKP